MSTCEPYNYTICHVKVWLYRLIPLPQVLFGTIGNILNITILSRRRMRKFSTTVYLICLAFADMLSLWSGVMPDLLYEGMAVPVRTNSLFLCKGLWWLSYAAAGYSVWLIVLMTMERTILTTSPVMARTSLSVKNAVIFASVAFVICTALSSHHLFGLVVKTETQTFAIRGNQTHTSNVSLCTHADEFRMFYTEVWPLVVVVVLVMIPFVIISIGNSVILTTLILQKRRLMKVNPAGKSSAVNAYNNRKSSTKTLFLICTLFALTAIPYTIDQMVSVHVKSPDPYIQAQKDLVTTFVFLLLNCNFMLNFVLYFVSGTLFKQELRALIGEIRTRFRAVVGTADVTETRTTNLTTDSSTSQTNKGRIQPETGPKKDTDTGDRS